MLSLARNYGIAPYRLNHRRRLRRNACAAAKRREPHSRKNAAALRPDGRLRLVVVAVEVVVLQIGEAIVPLDAPSCEPVAHHFPWLDVNASDGPS
eukprot:5641531-Pleurochrysis_carterae.AAC.1